MKITKRAWKRSAREYRSAYLDVRDRYEQSLEREARIIKISFELLEKVETLELLRVIYRKVIDHVPIRAIESAIRTDLDVCTDCLGDEDCEDSCECVCHDDPDAARLKVAEWLANHGCG